MIALGDYVEDKVTGFKGIVVAITEWLNGCTRLGVQSRELHEGKPVEPQWIDEPQVRKIRDPSGSLTPQAPAPTTGGPQSDPPLGRKGG